MKEWLPHVHTDQHVHKLELLDDICVHMEQATEATNVIWENQSVTPE